MSANGHKDILEARASLLSGLRSFFEARQSLEVDVPAIAKALRSDPWLDSFTVNDPAGLKLAICSLPRDLSQTVVIGVPMCIAIGKAYRANEDGSEHAMSYNARMVRPTSIRPFQPWCPRSRTSWRP